MAVDLARFRDNATDKFVWVNLNHVVSLSSAGADDPGIGLLFTLKLIDGKTLDVSLGKARLDTFLNLFGVIKNFD